METMKAVVKTHEADSTFSLEDIKVPEIGDDELLVKIRAIGVGIHDGYFLPSKMDFPYPIGIEAAGIIEAVGKDSEEFSVGERVVFVSMMQPKGGTWAEYAVVSKEALLLHIPDGVSFVTAASVPVAGNTVLKAFKELALEKGESLFIAGASGAIGTFAIQLAKKGGIHVAGSASRKNHDYMRSLGAESTVDYHDVDWQDQVKNWRSKGVDAALAIQPGTGRPSMNVVADGGIVVPVSEFNVTSERYITVKPVNNKVDVHHELKTMMQQIAEGEITLTIGDAYPLENALDALHKTTTRHARGSVVIDMDL